MKWWGWGDPERRLDLPPAAVDALREELGVTPEDTVEPVSLEEVDLPDARPIPEAVRSAAGEVLDGAEDRLRRSAGRRHPDLVRLRSRVLGGAPAPRGWAGGSYRVLVGLRPGLLERAPDAILRPADAADVEAVLTACAEAGVAVVPYGGGTSVVGGLDAFAGAHSAVVSLDLA